MSTVSNHTLAIALAVAAMLPNAATAQTAPAPDAASEATPPEADTGQVQEIIVSARRRDETIQNTPVAVSAIVPSMLEGKGTMNLTELQGAAPGVLITQQATGAATANISIRGIAFADVEKSFDPAVGINVDGVYIGTSTGQLLDFFDIASIEILRGPQGTLFGRNTIAGVINVRRTAPTGQWGAKVEGTFSSFGTVGLRAVVNVPVIKDVLAAKFFEFHQQSDGFYHDYQTGKRRGGSNGENFGASFLLTPSSNFDALLTVEQQSLKFDPIVGSLLRPGDAFCGAVPAGACGGNNTTDVYTAYTGSTPFFGNYRARAATLEMNLTTDFAKITSVTSYRNSKEDQEQDYGTAGIYDARRIQDYHQFSQEVRASGNLFPKFDYVVGLYYFDSKYDLTQITNVFGAPAGFQRTIGKSQSKAAFFDLNWEFLPKLRLSGGGRFTRDTKESINPLIVDPSSGNVGVSAKKSWSKFTPRLTLDYRPTDAIMGYASWSRGYRSGGFNGRGQTFFSATTPYNPETVSSYELGLKTQFFDRKLAINLAGYYTDYKSIQQTSTVTLAGGVGNETIVANAAGAKIKGIEADITARPFRNFSVSATAGYTKSNFKGFIVNQPVGATVRTFDFSNVDLIYAPKLTSSINADYKIPLASGTTITLSGGYRFITRYDQQVAVDSTAPIPATGTIIVQQNDPRVRSDKQNLLDASISVLFPMNQSGAKARFSVFARNLLDDRGTATSFDVGSYPTLWGFAAAREPRVFGVQAGFEF
jgi:iron complex outermembrane receptor protein